MLFIYSSTSLSEESIRVNKWFGSQANTNSLAVKVSPFFVVTDTTFLFSVLIFTISDIK